MEPLKDAGHFYEVERSQYRAQRPGYLMDANKSRSVQKRSNKKPLGGYSVTRSRRHHAII